MRVDDSHAASSKAQQDVSCEELDQLVRNLISDEDKGTPLYVDGRDSRLGVRELNSLIAAEILQPLGDHPTAESNGVYGPFLITESGIEFIKEVLRNLLGRSQSAEDKTSTHESRQPAWDSNRRELRFGSVLIKRFRKSAPNQERVLEAFEESGWVQRIDDPLPPKGDVAPALRLHDTINSLNRSMLNPLIRFGADGTGMGICWRYTAECD